MKTDLEAIKAADFSGFYCFWWSRWWFALGSKRRFQSAAGERTLGWESQWIALVISLGFEPKTHSLEGCCSIQLSYGAKSFAPRATGDGWWRREDSNTHNSAKRAQRYNKNEKWKNEKWKIVEWGLFFCSWASKSRPFLPHEEQKWPAEGGVS